MILTSSIETIKGIGPKTAEKLQAAGLLTVADLLEFYPRRYEDFSQAQQIADLQPGKVLVKAEVESVNVRTVRRGMSVTTAVLSDGSGKVQATWFNQQYRKAQLVPGDTFFFSGEFGFSYNRYQLTNPSVEQHKTEASVREGLSPLYSSVRGLKPEALRKIIAGLKPLMHAIPETLPPEILQKEKIISRAEAVLKTHFPAEQADIRRAKERLGYEELFGLLLASKLNKEQQTKLEGFVVPFSAEHARQFVAQLPFDLTADQRRAAWQILQDFEKKSPMNRLLQGDVGSGKTVVAGLAAAMAAQAGYQTALMAPTEILAEQHAVTLQKFLQPLGVSVGLLTGSVKGAPRKALEAAIASGEVDVVVGTHALFQKSVAFAALGFAIIDEQHRFGVNQRQELLAKSQKMPHLLAMTATPIPRSLALTLYGELEISILKEKPSGRKPIETTIFSPQSRPKVYEKIAHELNNGRQAYVICGLIDDNPENDRKSVEAEHKKLKTNVFKDKKVGLLHGKLSAAEKQQVMQDFQDKNYDILVSTTVVEVGVDVPNATVIMIEDADHFGLSQLHQLRGRVGRSEHQSYCFLMMSDMKKPSQRLQEIEKSNDGFYLAEVDLQLRGPGEIYGKAQHGDLNLKIASLADTKLIERTSRAAEQFITDEKSLETYPALQKTVVQYQKITTLN